MTIQFYGLDAFDLQLRQGHAPAGPGNNAGDPQDLFDLDAHFLQ